MAGAGGAMRATGWRATAIRFQQFGEGGPPACTISLTHSRARGADDGGRRRRDASYGVARDSHPVSTTAVRGPPACTISLTHSRARGADDGGRRRRDASYGVARDSHPVSTTAVRGLLWHRSLSGRQARGQRRAGEIDLRGARPAPAACAALCVAMDGGWRPTSMVCWCRSIAGEDSAGDDGPNAPRCDQHDTRRHPATSVSFWDGDR